MYFYLQTMLDFGSSLIEFHPNSNMYDWKDNRQSVDG